MPNIRKFLGKYPALIAGAVNIAAALIARFGVHVSADQLAVLVSVVTTALAGATHQATKPKPTAAPQAPAKQTPPADPSGG